MMSGNQKSALDDEIPLPSEQPPEVDFIQHRVTEFRDVEGNLPAQYDVARKRFVQRTRTVSFPSNSPSFDLNPEQIPDSSLVLAETTDSFSRAIDKLKQEKGVKKKGAKSTISEFNILSECHNWNEVMKTVRNVEATYTDTGSVSGKVREVFRRMGDNANSIKAFVGLLPDGNYKTLCGGLTLILTAMMRHSEVREAIAELLKDIPDFVQDCEDYNMLYEGNTMLQFRIHELYVELLAGLEEIVKWYAQPSKIRVVRSLLKNSTYGQEIDKRIQNIQKCRAKFHTEAQKFQHYQLHAMERIEWDTNGIAHDTKQGVGALAESVVQLKIEADARHEMIIKKMGDATSALNSLQHILGDTMKNVEWDGQIQILLRKMRDDEERGKRELREKDHQIAELRSQTESQAKRINHLAQTPQSLADRLGLKLDADALSEDIDHVYQSGLSESTKFQSRSRWVAQTSRFKNWLKSTSSKALIIQGCSDLETVSALSFLNVLLYEKLAHFEKALVLPFFCGLCENSSKRDKMPGPIRLIRSLIEQLLSLQSIDWGGGERDSPYLAFISPADMSGLEDGNVSTYLRTLSKLVLVLLERYDSVFIMIDGLDYFDDGWPDEAKELITSMMRLVRATKTRQDHAVMGSLKVLITVSTQLRYTPSSKKGMVKLEIPEDIDMDEDAFEEFEEEKVEDE